MWPVVLWQNRLLVIALAALALWGHGWVSGRQGERTRWEARTAQLRIERTLRTAQVVGQAAIITRLAAERAASLTRLEEMDRASPTADHPALGPDAVRRLLAR